MNCLIEGCTNDTRSRYTHKKGRICEEHWFKLPLKLREEWWELTDYSKNEPPEELIQRIREHYNADTRKPDQAEDQGSSQQVP